MTPTLPLPMHPNELNTISKKPGNLVLRTRFLLTRDKRSTHDVADAACVPFYWLRKFRTGEIVNPGADRVQKLYEFLTKRKLVA